MPNAARQALCRAVNRAIADGSPVFVNIQAPRALTVIYGDWVAADAAWMSEIKAAFPRKRAGNVRYQKEGEGEPGTALRAAYEVWRRLGDEYRETWAASGKPQGVKA